MTDTNRQNMGYFNFVILYDHLKFSFMVTFFLTLFQLLSCVLIFCDPMDYSLPGFSVHEILQARILEWVPISSKGSSRPRVRTCITFTARCIFTNEPPVKPFLTLESNWKTIIYFLQSHCLGKKCFEIQVQPGMTLPDDIMCSYEVLHRLQTDLDVHINLCSALPSEN